MVEGEAFSLFSNNPEFNRLKMQPIRDFELPACGISISIPSWACYHPWCWRHFQRISNEPMGESSQIASGVGLVCCDRVVGASCLAHPDIDELDNFTEIEHLTPAEFFGQPTKLEQNLGLGRKTKRRNPTGSNELRRTGERSVPLQMPSRLPLNGASGKDREQIPLASIKVAWDAARPLN